MGDVTLTEEPSEGPYCCKSCCANTWNDNDLCDECADLAQAEADAWRTPPADAPSGVTATDAELGPGRNT